jgi:hypothetical protein
MRKKDRSPRPEPAVSSEDGATSAESHPLGVRLGDLAHSRSGDKGNRANIGVVAFDRECYAWLRENLTDAAVAEYLRPLGAGAVTRYELPNIRAFNFVVENALGGGASRSLRLDSQGKALAAALLEMRVPGPDPPGRLS